MIQFPCSALLFMFLFLVINYIAASVFGSVAAALQADGDLCGPGESI